MPFSLIYLVLIAIRKWMYDKKVFSSSAFGLPVVCVGNLSVGGTGKSPMVEYLVEMLKDKFQVATLSRGYKRKTKGYALAGNNSTALDIGDEPMQFHLKFPDVAVAVGEERLEAIPQLLHDRPRTEVIILDDAFQHRRIRAGLNILLTDYGNLFTRDFYLPTGDLRDLKSSYKRADIIIVTKCRHNLSMEEKQKIIREIKPLAQQSVFFTTSEYAEPYHIFEKTTTTLGETKEVLLVSGIANPRPLKKMLEEKCGTYYMMQYPDHFIFNIDDLRDIIKRFESIESNSKIILTTEKDAVRLIKFNDVINTLPLYVQPVRHSFLFEEENSFLKKLTGFIENFN